MAAANGALHLLLGGEWDGEILAGPPMGTILPWVLYGLAIAGTLLAVLGGNLLRMRNSSLFWLALVTVGYFIATSAGAEAVSCGARFRTPFVAIEAIFIAAGIRRLVPALLEPERAGKILVMPAMHH